MISVLVTSFGEMSWNLSELCGSIAIANFLNIIPVKWILIALLIVGIISSIFGESLRRLWLILRLPGPPGHPIIGHIMMIFDPERFNAVRHTYRKLYGPVSKTWNLFFPVVLVTDPEDIQKILSSSKHLQKPFYYSYFGKNLFGEGLLISEGSEWKNHRRLLLPHYHVKNIEEYLPVFDKGSRLLNEAFKQNMEKTSGVINITSLVNKSILYILSEAILGLELDPKAAFEEIESLPYKQSSNKIAGRFHNPWFEFDFIYKWTSSGKKEMDFENLRKEFTKKLIRERREMREKGEVKNKCFLDFLLDIADDENFTEDDCEKEACTSLLAGQDSVATTLAFCLHQIANNQQVQRKIVDELDLIFGASQRSPDASDIRKMIYLEQCIKETMRLYPVVPGIMRTLGEDVKAGNYLLPKGCTVIIPFWLTHVIEEIYPNPEIFNPDNFEPTKCEVRHPCAFLSFSSGPRNCIGYKFGMIELKTIISNILRQYWLNPVPGKEKVNIVCKVTLRASGGIWIKFTPKENKKKDAYC